MNNKKFGLLSVLNLLMISALVLAACSRATPSAALEPATQPRTTTHLTFALRTASLTSAPAASIRTIASVVKGQIVYYAWVSGQFQIYIEQADGSGVHQIVKSEFNDFYPVLSPDGRTVIFQRYIPDNTHLVFGGIIQIFMVNVDGTNLHQIDPGSCVLPCYTESFDGHAYSPNGKQIVFNRPLVGPTGEPTGDGDFVSFGLWVMNTDGSGLYQVTQMKPNSGESDESAGWSPDGKRLVFQRNTSQGFAIFTIATDGSDLRQVTPWDLSANQPDWSRDGGLIAFQSPTEGDQGVVQNIYAIHPDGTGLTQLTNYTSADGSTQVTFGPSWSPNGRQIAFSHYPSTSGSIDIFVMNRDGSDLHVLAPTAIDEQITDWGISSGPKFKY
jgi:Tol biopolymer transport system component